MEKAVSDFVTSSIKLKAYGIRTIDTGIQYPEVDVQELGARLRANGALTMMMKYVAECIRDNKDYSIQSTWQSSQVGIETLIAMRNENTRRNANTQF